MQETETALKSQIFPFFIPHAGCPHHCIYCDQHAITQHSGDISPKQLIDLERFCQSHSEVDKEIAFYGGSFNLLPQAKRFQYYQLTKSYIDNHTHLRVSVFPTVSNPELLSEFRQHSVCTIEVGIQSFNNQVLEKSGRSYTAAVAESFCREVKAADFQLSIQLMPGLPGYGKHSLRETMRITLDIKPELLRIYPLVVLRGTEIALHYQQGKYTPLTLGRAVVITAWMSGLSESHGIQLIKAGLHGDISSENIVAGPFHPQFGEMVRAYRYFQKVRKAYKKHSTLCISPKDVSLFKGRGGACLQNLKTAFGVKKIPIVIDTELKKDSFSVNNIKSDFFW
ncbi:MAG: radical SAM protein [Candidatus Cloacimonetes bacterium]|nr:radical SAM protein [Candidatus Cloacimonadota bacterium]